MLATAVMVLLHWFKDDINAGAAAIANAAANALGVPPLSYAYVLLLETLKMLLQKIKRDLFNSIRSDGRKEGREAGIKHLLRQQNPQADEAEIHRRYEEAITAMSDDPGT